MGAMTRYGDYTFGAQAVASHRLPTREECDLMVADFEARKGITRLPDAYAVSGAAPRDEAADVLRGRGS